MNKLKRMENLATLFYVQLILVFVAPVPYKYVFGGLCILTFALIFLVFFTSFNDKDL